MCGRYVIFSDEDIAEMQKIMNDIDMRYGNEQSAQMIKGDIFPSNIAPVIIYENNNFIPLLMNWGFHNFNSKGLIINARAETVTQKSLFKQSFYTRRCIVPCNGFYEWKHNQLDNHTTNTSTQKYIFTTKDSKMLYMAGIFSQEEGSQSSRFVILTTQANDSVSGIHNRMPLVLNRNELSLWLRNTQSAINILAKPREELNSVTA